MDWRILIVISQIYISSVLSSAENEEEIWWNQAGRSIGSTLRDCWSLANTIAREKETQYHIVGLGSCLQQRTKGALKELLNSDVIPLADGVELVRYQEKNHTGNVTRKNFNRISRMDYIPDSPSFSSWRSLFIDTITDVFNTHAIRIYIQDHQTSPDNEARRRRRRHHMMPLMAFGLVGLGMILIPMGFQFLAVLGGKALLLAKMALMLTSIQGLKKIAHSNINYGLYHSAPANPWYDRKAEDVEIPYRMEDVYHNYFPRQGYQQFKA